MANLKFYELLPAPVYHQSSPWKPVFYLSVNTLPSGTWEGCLLSSPEEGDPGVRVLLTDNSVRFVKRTNDRDVRSCIVLNTL